MSLCNEVKWILAGGIRIWSDRIGSDRIVPEASLTSMAACGVNNFGETGGQAKRQRTGNGHGNWSTNLHWHMASIVSIALAWYVDLARLGMRLDLWPVISFRRAANKNEHGRPRNATRPKRSLRQEQINCQKTLRTKKQIPKDSKFRSQQAEIYIVFSAATPATGSRDAGECQLQKVRRTRTHIAIYLYIYLYSRYMHIQTPRPSQFSPVSEAQPKTMWKKWTWFPVWTHFSDSLSHICQWKIFAIISPAARPLISQAPLAKLYWLRNVLRNWQEKKSPFRTQLESPKNLSLTSLSVFPAKKPSGGEDVVRILRLLDDNTENRPKWQIMFILAKLQLDRKGSCLLTTPLDLILLSWH